MGDAPTSRPSRRRHDVEPLIVNRRDEGELEAARAVRLRRATTDWREVIAARPDIVALTGPGRLRAEQARAALDAGCHILAEKPFTLTRPTPGPSTRWRGARPAVVLCYAWNEMGIARQRRGGSLEDGGSARSSTSTSR